jgi:hypothetical protein
MQHLFRMSELVIRITHHSACASQDLDGFDADMTLKAIHASPGRPQGAAMLAQSASLPLPPRREELAQLGGRAQGTPSKARGLLGRSSMGHAAGEQGLTPAAAERGRGLGRSLTYTAGEADGSAAAQQEGGEQDSGQVTSQP